MPFSFSLNNTGPLREESKKYGQLPPARNWGKTRLHSFWGGKKNNKHKTHKHSSHGPCGTITPPIPGTNGTKWRFDHGVPWPVCPRGGFVPGTGPVCSRDGSHLSRPGTVHVCPDQGRDSSCLSRTPSRPKCFRGQTRHINNWHVSNFLVTPVTDLPGRVPGRKCLCPLGSAHSTQTFGPWPSGQENPPHPLQGVTRQNCLCLHPPPK